MGENWASFYILWVAKAWFRAFWALTLLNFSSLSLYAQLQEAGGSATGYRGPLSVSLMGAQQQANYKNTLNQSLTATGLSYGGALSLRLWSEANSELRLFGQALQASLLAPSSSNQESFSIQRQGLQVGLKSFIGKRFFIQAAYVEVKNKGKLAQSEIELLQQGLGLGAGVEFRVAQNWFCELLAQAESLQGDKPSALLGSGDSQSYFYGISLTWSPSLTVRPSGSRP
jgi:hypothetical protein